MTPGNSAVTPAMIAFTPLGTEIRIILPAAEGAVVHGRVRLFLSDKAGAYTTTTGEADRQGVAGTPEPVTIYDVIGISEAMLEELVGMILANSTAAALFVRLPDGTAGKFTRSRSEPLRSR
jgi:hypothetical protein